MEEKERIENNDIKLSEQPEDITIPLTGTETGPDQTHMPGQHPESEAVRGMPVHDAPPQKGKHLKKWQRLKKNQKKNEVGKYLTIALITLVLLVGGFFGARLAIRNANLREAGISSAQCIGMKCGDIREQLTAAGFENLHILAVEDLEYSDLGREGEVFFVAVEDRTSFEAIDRFDKNADVFLLYHSAKAVVCPMNLQDAKTMTTEDVEKAFLDAGFVNVKLEPVPDLVFGWIHKDGEIKSITIDGQSKLMAGTSQRVDSEVIISYHTFKEK